MKWILICLIHILPIRFHCLVFKFSITSYHKVLSGIPTTYWFTSKQALRMKHIFSAGNLYYLHSNKANCWDFPQPTPTFSYRKQTRTSTLTLLYTYTLTAQVIQTASAAALFLFVIALLTVFQFCTYFLFIHFSIDFLLPLHCYKIVLPVSVLMNYTNKSNIQLSEHEADFRRFVGSAFHTFSNFYLCTVCATHPQLARRWAGERSIVS